MVAPAGALPILALSIACATVAPEAPRSHIPEGEAPYLLNPLVGYPLAVDPALDSRIGQGFAVLRSGGDLAALEASTAELVEREPGFHPARVLLADVAFLRGRDAAARDLLKPTADELPGYLACQLLLGRVEERLDDLPAAFEAYRRAAPSSSVAGDRAAELEPRVVEILVRRSEDLIRRGLLEDARREIARLEEWAPEEIPVLRMRRELAFAEGDVEAEIEALTRLLDAVEDRERAREVSGEAPLGEPLAEGYEELDAGALRERLADLQLADGDIRAAIATLEQLVPERPDDQELAEKLERAKFLWRLQLLPEHVQEVASKSVLSRADLATLLYWLVPAVRYSEVAEPPIATDILDHPRREEILPVMALGLIPVDQTLHRFSPDLAATRVLTLGALLGLLRWSGDVACLSALEAEALAGSWSLTCRKAADCRLIPETADCLPQAEISGPDALDLFRRALDLLATR